MDWDKAGKYNESRIGTDRQTSLVAWVQILLGDLEIDGMLGPDTELTMASNVAAVADGMVEEAFTQAGKPYVFGAEVDLDDPDPAAFDCSELVQWAAHRAGLRMPDGSWNQVSHCRDKLTLISVDLALDKRGALLFKFSSNPFRGERPSSAHVAISLGNGTTIEARSTNYGVGSFSAAGRGWTHAGLIPL